MTRQPRFEIVRTDAGHHARFVAANGRIVWTTEGYTRRRAAEDAVVAILTVAYSGAQITRHVDERGGAS